MHHQSKKSYRAPLDENEKKEKSGRRKINKN